MGGPQARAPERSHPGAQRPPVGNGDLATPCAPTPAGSPDKGRAFRGPEPTAPGPSKTRTERGRLLPSAASQHQSRKRGAGPCGPDVRTGDWSAGGAPGGGVPGAGRHQAAGRCTVSLESPGPTLRPEMTASKRVAKVTVDDPFLPAPLALPTPSRALLAHLFVRVAGLAEPCHPRPLPEEEWVFQRSQSWSFGERGHIRRGCHWLPEPCWGWG